jgi:hypothetical protein
MEQPKLSMRSALPVTRKSVVFKKSQARLAELQFDPIEELVLQYRAIEGEIRYQELIRSGQITELRQDGKPKAYNADRHLALYDRLANIADKLLRYGYGRVPELTNINDGPKPTFVVNLTRPGEQYVINSEEATVPDELVDESDTILDVTPIK